ncbi:MAG: MbnP family protein [Bacteroidota bacterium]
MKSLQLLFLCLPLFIAGCMDDDDSQANTTAVAVDFRAAYDGADLTIQDIVYDYPSGAELKTTLFQYYVSDLELLPADGGTPVRLSEIELIRYESAGGSPVITKTYDVPVGEYSALRFGLGVKPALNAQDPNNFAADFVLNENEFWNANARYVFAKIEANADLENDGTFDTGLSYHLGSDALYTTITFNGTIDLNGTNNPRLTVLADVLKALASDTEFFDISDASQQGVHGGNQAIGQAIWDRLAGQFTLELR